MKRFLLLCFVFSLGYSQCPWDDSSLLAWSSSSAKWTTPTANADVVIDNVKILLDTQPPTLNSITIQNGGQLVWGNVDNIEIKARYILVSADGRFDIGSESCLFDKKAIITLYGKDGEGTAHPMFGRKYLGVDANGTLEFHSSGPTPSWTQLSASASSSSYSTTAGGRGFNLARINPETGEFIEASRYDTYDGTGTDAMIAYLDALPQGACVLFAAMDSATPGPLNATLQKSIEAFGAAQIANLRSRDSYALMGIKGAANGTVPEVFTKTNTTAAILSRNFTDGQISPTSKAYNVYILSAGWMDGNKIVISVTTNLNPILTFKEPVNWPVGSQLVLSSTDFSYQQYEEATTIQCDTCSQNQVKLSAPLKYLHYGEIQHGVDMRCEVAVLNRKITVQGQMESACYQTSPSYLCTLLPYDTFGGHFKVLNGFKNVHIENVEFYHMGQQIIGNYPVHFHMCGDVDEVGGYTNRTYVKGASVHHSFSRCVTIHATNGLWVKDTVGYDHLGHCFFLEDGIEIRNILEHNLGLVTRPGTLLPTDRDNTFCTAINPTDFNGNPTSVGECNAISTYWVENPNNDLIGNVAAGSIQVGFWYILPYRPTGPSEQAGINGKVFPQNTPLGKFVNNSGHSNGRNALFFDDGVKITPASANAPEEFLSHTSMRYKPRAVPHNMSSERVPAVFENFTAYKNRERGVWVRGGDFRFINFFSSDNPIGMTLASEGAYPNDPGSSQTLVGGVFIGESANKGSAGFGVDFFNGRTYGNYRGFPIRGFEFYDGPVSIKDVKFVNFNPNGVNNASAIGWLLTNHWQLSPRSNLSSVSFENVTNRVYNKIASGMDGDINSVFHDIDGSCTGVRNSSVATLSPFFNTYRCSEQPSWNAQICHEKMGNFFINNLDAANTNYNGVMGGITFVRDDRYEYQHAMVGIPGNVQFQPVIIHNKTYTIHWPHASPPAVRISAVNFDLGMWSRVGVCFPADPSLTFAVSKGNGSYINNGNLPLTKVNSVAEVDADPLGNSYYFDSDTGLLFVRIVATLSRVGDNYCPPLGCESIVIRATGSSLGTNTGYCSAAYPKYAVQEYVPSDPGCIGEYDGCGVCNGDDSTCCVDDCSSIDENMVCAIPNCVCKAGFELVNGKCEVVSATTGGVPNGGADEEVSAGQRVVAAVALVAVSMMYFIL